MKKIYMMLLAMATAVMTFTSCSDEDPYFTAGPDDFPRILNTDLPKWVNGEPGSKGDISRDQAFKYEALVSPKDYCKVEWEFDGDVIHEGAEINQTLLAGRYLVRLVVTNTAHPDMVTSRTFYQTVTPLEGDPQLTYDRKACWLTPGKTAKIKGQNLEKVKGAKIGDVVVENFVNNGSSISFTAPTGFIAEDDMETVLNKQLVLIAEGEEGEGDVLYGGTSVTITNQQYKDAGVDILTLWEGSQAAPDWTTEDWFSSNMQALIASTRVRAGSHLNIELAATEGADYSLVSLIDGSWAGITTGEADPNRGDISLSGTDKQEISIELTNEVLARIAAGGIYLTGHGYEIYKVTVECTAPVATTIWSGSQDCPDWTTVDMVSTKIQNMIAKGQVSAGAKLAIEVTAAEGADYSSVAIIDNGWAGITTGEADPNRGDVSLEANETKEISIVLTQDMLDRIAAGGIYLTGHGYKISRVDIDCLPPSPMVLWEGDKDAPDWTNDDMFSTKMQTLIADGKVMPGQQFYIEVAAAEDADYSLVSLIDGSWAGITTGEADPNRGDISLNDTEKTEITFELTAEIIDRIAAGGIFATGHGYKIYKVGVR